MVNLCGFSLTRQLQVVVHWSQSLHFSDRDLPLGQELAIGSGDEKKDMVARLKLPGLRRMVVEVALLSLGREHRLAHSGGHLLNSVLP